MNPSVILVSPKGAGNVGGVARLMGNFGLKDLRIVSPRCDLKSLECKQMSMASFHIIESARIYPNLEHAQGDRTLSIALSGKRKEDDRPRKSLFEFVRNFSEIVHPDDKVAFVFGREEWGLRIDELDQCDYVLEIPTTEEKPSINLTSAVAITLAFLFESKTAEMQKEGRRELSRPSKTDEDLFFNRAHKVLDYIKFLNPQNPFQNLEDLRAMYHRAAPSDRDLRILFGILSGIEDSLARNRDEEPSEIQSTSPSQ
ncbi:MAG: trmJ [Bacteriovoracaceae bacterium]|nr:trmJ [Bacteriovoracaceae bacterium]